MWGAEQRLRDTILQASERDKQRRIGPSDLGNNCEHCLGAAMLREGGGGTFHQAAWLGTCVHLWMEQNELDPKITTEQRFKDIIEVPGYGLVSGTADRYAPYDRAVIDIKTTTKARLAKLMRGIVTVGGEIVDLEPQMLTNYVQANAYGMGAEAAGLDVEQVALYFIARDGTHPRDNKYVSFDYNPAVVESYARRAGEIFRRAQEGGLETLEVDPDCWPCMVAGR